MNLASKHSIAIFSSLLVFSTTAVTNNYAADRSSIEPSSAITDHHEQIKKLENAADSGDARSAAILSNHYRASLFVQENHDKAFAYARKAAESGDAQGLYALGRCYGKGIGVPKDIEKEIDLIKQARPGLDKSAQENDPWAQIALAYCWSQGIGSPKDDSKAMEWFEKAAGQGFVAAQYYLGFCLLNGQGVNKDARKAAEWFEKAAAQGYAVAQCNLGACFLKGQGVNKDARKGMEWLQKAAEQGDAQSQGLFGFCMLNGIGVSRNEKKGMEWLVKGVAKNNDFSQASLGACYEAGLGVVKDERIAVELFKKAAAQGNVIAQHALDRRGIAQTKISPTESADIPALAPVVASAKETDCFEGKTLHGEKREGPTIKGLQIGMHITEARDILSQQAEKILAMKFRVVKYDDGYGIRGTSTKPDKAETVEDALEKLRDVSANQAVSILNAMESKFNGGKARYSPGADEVYVFAGQDGVVKGIGFPPFVVEKLFAEVSELPIAQFVAQYTKAYLIPLMDLSFSEKNEPIYKCVTKDGVVITVSQRMETMKAIEIDKKDVRGAKGFN